MTTRISFRQTTRAYRPTTAVPPPPVRAVAMGPRRGPRLLLLLLLVGIASLSAIAWYRSVHIHTYGVVSTGMELFHAPVRSTMVAIHVEPGDQVAADQLLFVLRSDESAAGLEQLRSELARAEVALEQERSHSDQADPVRTRDLQVAAERIHRVERSLLRLDGDHQRDRHDNDRQLGERRLLLAGEEEQLRRQRQRGEVLQGLLEQGAATRSELTATATDRLTRQLRCDTLRQQIADLASLRQRTVQHYDSERQRLLTEQRGAEQDLLRLQAEYDEVASCREDRRRQRIADLQEQITGLHALMEHLGMLAGPTEVRALADGVVMEIAVSVGSTVAKDGIIMSVAGTGKSWISAFVPAEDSARLAIGQAVRIYPSAGGGPLPGRISGGGGLEYKVHPALRERIDAFSAVYTRIDLEDGGEGLIPGNVVEVVID